MRQHLERRLVCGEVLPRFELGEGVAHLGGQTVPGTDLGAGTQRPLQRRAVHGVDPGGCQAVGNRLHLAFTGLRQRRVHDLPGAQLLGELLLTVTHQHELAQAVQRRERIVEVYGAGTRLTEHSASEPQTVVGLKIRFRIAS